MKAKVYSYKTGKAKFEGIRSTGPRNVELSGECKVDVAETVARAKRKRR